MPVLVQQVDRGVDGVFLPAGRGGGVAGGAEVLRGESAVRVEELEAGAAAGAVRHRRSGFDVSAAQSAAEHVVAGFVEFGQGVALARGVFVGHFVISSVMAVTCSASCLSRIVAA